MSKQEENYREMQKRAAELERLLRAEAAQDEVMAAVLARLEDLFRQIREGTLKIPYRGFEGQHWVGEKGTFYRRPELEHAFSRFALYAEGGDEETLSRVVEASHAFSTRSRKLQSVCAQLAAKNPTMQALGELQRIVLNRDTGYALRQFSLFARKFGLVLTQDEMEQFNQLAAEVGLSKGWFDEDERVIRAEIRKGDDEHFGGEERAMRIDPLTRVLNRFRRRFDVPPW